MRLWLFMAALNGFLAVAAGAYGYHWLEVSDSGFRDVFNALMAHRSGCIHQTGRCSQDMGIDHGRLYAAMAEKLPDRAES